MDMLLIYRKIRELDFSQLVSVYEESIRQQGRSEYPYLDDYEQRLRVEQDLYQYLLESFASGAICAVWASEGRYKAALRLEPHHDGLLLTSLETAPQHRRKGYAEALVHGVLEAFSDTLIYSHISCANKASAALHMKCGFCRCSDHAVYLDGSVSTEANTYVFKNNVTRSQ